MKKMIAALILLNILCSCNREYSCTNDTIKLNFIGFAKADIDTLVIRQFSSGNNFQQLNDTFNIVVDTNGVSQVNDTISFGGSSLGNIIQYGSDWQVFVPAQNKLVSISNIVSPQEQGKCRTGGKILCVCDNNIQSVMQDGQTITYAPRDTSFNGYQLYIHK